MNQAGLEGKTSHDSRTVSVSGSNITSDSRSTFIAQQDLDYNRGEMGVTSWGLSLVGVPGSLSFMSAEWLMYKKLLNYRMRKRAHKQ